MSQGLVRAPPAEDRGAGRMKKQGAAFHKWPDPTTAGHPGKFTSNKSKDKQIKTGGKEMKSGW